MKMRRALFFVAFWQVRLLVLVAILFVISTRGQSQPEPPPSWAPQLVPATPNATKMTEYYAQRPNMYTGTANVSIPLYTIDFEGWKLPLSISYNATGIRPNEEASEVGLGWSLSATGVISRSISGVDDLYRGQQGTNTKGFVFGDREVTSVMGFNPLDYPLNNSPVPPQNSYYRHLALDRPDTQPDTFNYNFFGFSGSFTLSQKVIDTAGQVHVVKLTEDACKIEYHESDDTFTVITPQGFKGTFSVKEISTTFSSTAPNGTSPSNTLECCSASNIDITYYEDTSGQFRTISSWYLSSIISPRGKVIAFTYYVDAGGATSHISLSRAFGEFPGTTDRRLCVQTVHEHMYLKRIANEDIQIDLAMEYRDDVRRNTLLLSPLGPFPNGEKLRRYAGIQVQGLGSSTLSKQITFKQSYFNQTYHSVSSDTENEMQFLRSRLDRLIIEDQEYSFFYERPNDLPDKLTSAIDHFGFYNGVRQEDDMLLPPDPMPSESFLGAFTNPTEIVTPAYYHQKYSRGVDINYGKIGSLTKVVYPTHGYSVFEYEAHRYLPSQTLFFREDPVGPEGNLAGGVRIKFVSDFDYTDNLVQRKEYRYRDNLNENFSATTGRIMTPLYNRYPAYYRAFPVYEFKYRSHSGIPGSTSAQGRLIGYSKVFEIVIGKTESFHNTYYFENTPNRVLDHNASAGGFPNLNGQATRTVNHNSEDRIVQVTENDLYANFTGKVKGVIYESQGGGSEYLLYQVPFEVDKTFITPKKITTTLTSPVSTMVVDARDSIITVGNSLQTTTLTTYDDTTFLQGSQKITNSVGDTLETIYKRPSDYGSPSPALVYMKGASVNMIEPIIEEISTRNGVEISARGNLYGLVNGTLVNLLSSYAWNPAKGPFIGSSDGAVFPRYEVKVTFNKYDNDGRVLEYTASDGVTNSFIWGYNNKLPIVHGLNINHTSLSQAYTAALSGNYETAIRSHANTTGKQINTYEHNPLVGVKKVTDQNGLKKTFQYDASERLVLVQDNDGNILKENRYHFIERLQTRVLAVNTSSLDFGTQMQDYFAATFLPYEKCGSATRKLTLTNTGENELQISDMQLPEGFDSDWGGGTLQPGVSTDIVIYFNKEKDMPNGTYGGDIQFISNKTSGVSSVGITSSLVARTCTFDVPAAVDFGSTTGSFVGKQLVVTNTGNGPLRIIETTLNHPDFQLNVSPGPSCIPPGGSQSFQVSFIPHATGAQQSTFYLKSDVQGCNTTNVTLLGTKTN